MFTFTNAYLSRLAQAVTLLTCVQMVEASNLYQDTD